MTPVELAREYLAKITAHVTDLESADEELSLQLWTWLHEDVESLAYLADEQANVLFNQQD